MLQIQIGEQPTVTVRLSSSAEDPKRLSKEGRNRKHSSDDNNKGGSFKEKRESDPTTSMSNYSTEKEKQDFKRSQSNKKLLHSRSEDVIGIGAPPTSPRKKSTEDKVITVQNPLFGKYEISFFLC